MLGSALLLMVAAGAPASAHNGIALAAPQSEPGLELDRGRFALPIVDYRAPDGTWKHGDGIIIGRDVAPNATVGIGFFRMKPKSQEPENAPFARKSHKVSLGVSLHF